MTQMLISVHLVTSVSSVFELFSYQVVEKANAGLRRMNCHDIYVVDNSEEKKRQGFSPLIYLFVRVKTHWPRGLFSRA